MIDAIQEVEVGAQKFRVLTRGGEGIPLLMCNGIGASLELLQPFVDQLSRDIPVVLFDAPGVGGSSLPQLPYTFHTFSCVLGKLLDELGVDRVDILGISWGGGLAQQFAFQNPRRARRLVLVSTGTGALMVPGHPSVLAKMLTPRRHRDANYAAENAAHLYGGKMRDEPYSARGVLGRRKKSTTRRGYLMQLLAGGAWTSLPFLPLLRQRTLIVAGNDDPIIPLINGKIMDKLLPNSRLHVYDDGHLGLVTSAEELAPVIGAFLREQ